MIFLFGKISSIPSDGWRYLPERECSVPRRERCVEGGAMAGGTIAGISTGEVAADLEGPVARLQQQQLALGLRARTSRAHERAQLGVARLPGEVGDLRAGPGREVA